MKLRILNNQDRDAFVEYVQKVEVKSAWHAEFTKIRRKRSLESNAYMWLIFTIEQEVTGLDKTDIYLFYLYKFPTFKEVERDNEIHLVPITSSYFDTMQMTVFINNVRREMAMNEIETPDPDSQRALDAYNYYREAGIL